MHTAHLARFGSERMPFDDFQTALCSLSAQALPQPVGRQVIYSTLTT